MVIDYQNNTTKIAVTLLFDNKMYFSTSELFRWTMVSACVFSESTQSRASLVADSAQISLMLYMLRFNMVKYIVPVLGGESTIMTLPKD